MLDIEKIKRVRHSGAIWGQRWVTFKSIVLWHLPALRRIVYKRRYNVRVKVLKEFIETFKAVSRVRLVACDGDGCQPYGSQVGIDFDSEKHGWEYLGGHFWNCPKCEKTS